MSETTKGRECKEVCGENNTGRVRCLISSNLLLTILLLLDAILDGNKICRCCITHPPLSLIHRENVGLS